MKYELKCVEGNLLTQEERITLDAQIDSIIDRYKNNRYQVNRLVFESAAALTASNNLAQKKASQGFFSRFWNNLTGKNQRIQADIDRNLARAQYASQQTLQKLAEQNLMSFELITAVNNKLNASMIAVEKEINTIYGTMLEFFKRSRADIIRLETRVERLERNVDLLNWQNSIEYQMYNGVEYCELDDVTKMVCLTRDFYNITRGEWRTSDLLLLKSAMGTIGLDVHGKMSYEKFVRQVGTNHDLYQHLIGEDFKVNQLATGNELLAVSLGKMDKLGKEEQYLVVATESILQKHGIELSSDSIAYQMVDEYVVQEENVRMETEVGHYEMALEILYNMEQLKYSKELNEKFKHAKTLFLNCRIQEAIPLLEDLSNAGISQARYILALIYYEAINVDYDYNFDRVKSLLEINAQEGDIYSARLCSDVGLNIDSDYYEYCKEALAKLAENGDVFACHELERMWIMDFITGNNELSLKYCRMGVDGGFFLSYFRMGVVYYEGDDNKMAEKYLMLAADIGYGKAMARIGDYYFYNHEGIVQDNKKAIEWYKKAYEAGYSVDFTINQIARSYSSDGGSGDNSEALRWWHIGEDKGYSMCIANLGWAYRWGQGVAVDYQKAMEYFRRASEIDSNSYAERNLGDMYLNGNGVSSDRAAARSWYEKAAEKGDEDAKKWLNNNPS